MQPYYDTFSATLRRLIAESGKTQSEVAAAIGVSAPTLSDWARGKKLPRMNKVEKLASYFGVSKTELIEGKKPDIGLPVHEIPIVGLVRAGLPILAMENRVGTMMTTAAGSCFALRVQGDSMNARGIVDGGLVTVRQDADVRDGDIVVALIEDEATVKELRHSGSSVVLMPRSLDPSYLPIIVDKKTVGFQILGKVVSFTVEF